jgi:hypothetical protein
MSWCIAAPKMHCITSLFHREDVPLEMLLCNFRQKVLPSDEDDKSRLNIRRKHLMEDSFRRFRAGIDLNKHLSVTFAGESAVDTGGPLREFLRLFTMSIFRSNTLFCGSDYARVPTHNVIELEKRSYYFVGATIALSFIHGGPPPRCLSSAVADYIVYGVNKVAVSPDDIPNDSIRDKVIKVYFDYCVPPPTPQHEFAVAKLL